MRVGILAGGIGSRLAEETVTRPKPMVEIGGLPILWHIMKYYSEFGHRDFYVALGYKGDYIKRWMVGRADLGANVSVDMATREVTYEKSPDDFTVHCIETGANTNTGGRIKRLLPYLAEDGTFLLTWGDGLSTVDLDDLVAFHRRHGKLLTMTAVRPSSRFGHLEIGDDGLIGRFTEKPQMEEGWINGAFFVCEPGIDAYIDGDATLFEAEPLTRLAADGQAVAYRHDGFWQCMDTVRDRNYLESLWDGGDAPWCVWE